MTYVPTYAELGSDGAVYHMVGNVAVPDDAATLAVFQGIQRSLNALLAVHREALIGVDGRLGGATLAAALIMSNDPGSLPDTQTMAEAANAFYAALQNQMVLDSAAYVPDPITSSPPSIASGAGVVNPTDKQIRDAEPTSIITYAAIAIGAGVILSYLMKKKRRKKR
jgi:hypothetical protein